MTSPPPLIPAKAGTQAFFNHQAHQAHQGTELGRGDGSRIGIFVCLVCLVVDFFSAPPTRLDQKNLSPRFRGDERIIEWAAL